ncbi:MAG: C45 family autoproteolytic acyltransferase/hydrolase [Promethearchaeati archaeon]
MSFIDQVNHPFPLIEIQGNSTERGFEYGTKCRDLINRRIDILRNIIKSNIFFNVTWSDVLKKAKIFLSSIRQYDPQIVEELDDIAEGAERSFDEILLLNVIYEFFSLNVDGVWSGCTAVAITPESSLKSKTIVGQNDDWNEVFQDVSVLLKIDQEQGPRIVQFCDAGTIGGNGFNSEGISLCGNSLLSNNWNWKGIPHMILKRGALNAMTLSDAIRAITSARRCSSHNYLLAHSQGEAVDIETAPHEVSFLMPQEGILTHSNHFVTQKPNIQDLKVNKSPNSIIRKHRSSKLLQKKNGSITVDTVKEMFRDHFDFPHSICRHPSPENTAFHQIQTNASIIMDLTNSRLFLTRGTPCKNEYSCFQF